jgi:leucine-rich repeat protein SHOC2
MKNIPSTKRTTSGFAFQELYFQSYDSLWQFNVKRFGQRTLLLWLLLNIFDSSYAYHSDHVHQMVAQCNALPCPIHRLVVVQSQVPNDTNLSSERLNLSHQKLRKVPKRILQHANTRVLDLSHNQLWRLPGWLIKLPALETLIVSHNQKLRFLPRKLLKRRRLTYIQADNCNLVPGVLQSIVDYCPNIQHLDLANNNITFLPDSLSSRPIHYLNLNNNRLRQLNEKDYYRLANIDSLCLAGNQLSALPFVSDAQWQAAYLDLRYNRLKTLSPIYWGLPRLACLLLDHNQLQEITLHDHPLPHLHTLSLAHNQIQRLPFSTADFPQLARLDLSHNPELELPSRLANLPPLTHLSINGYPHKHLPESWQSLTALRNLQLADGQLSIIPSFLARLPMLDTLRIQGAPISILPANVDSLPTIDSLTVQGLVLHDDAPLFRLSRLKYLHSLDTLSYLDLIRCQLHFPMATIAAPAPRDRASGKSIGPQPDVVLQSLSTSARTTFDRYAAHCLAGDGYDCMHLAEVYQNERQPYIAYQILDGYCQRNRASGHYHAIDACYRAIFLYDDLTGDNSHSLSAGQFHQLCDCTVLDSAANTVRNAACQQAFIAYSHTIADIERKIGDIHTSIAALRAGREVATMTADVAMDNAVSREERGKSGKASAVVALVSFGAMIGTSVAIGGQQVALLKLDKQLQRLYDIRCALEASMNRSDAIRK